MRVEDVYVSPNDEVFVTNFMPNTIDGIIDEDQYHLEVGKWYKRGLKPIAPNVDDFVFVIHSDNQHIPHDPKNFMTIEEYRNQQLDKII